MLLGTAKHKKPPWLLRLLALSTVAVIQDSSEICDSRTYSTSSLLTLLTAHLDVDEYK